MRRPYRSCSSSSARRRPATSRRRRPDRAGRAGSPGGRRRPTRPPARSTPSRSCTKREPLVTRHRGPRGDACSVQAVVDEVGELVPGPHVDARAARSAGCRRARCAGSTAASRPRTARRTASLSHSRPNPAGVRRLVHEPWRGRPRPRRTPGTSSSSARPSATVPPASDSPWPSRAASCGTSGRGPDPSADVTTHAPFSSPVSSDHQAMPEPSGSTTTDSTPTAWSVSRTDRPLVRSWHQACTEPSASLT